MRQGIFLPRSTFSADSLTVSVQPPCASESARVKKKRTLAAIPLFGHTKILHTLIGMSSTALAAAVPYSGKGTRFSLSNNEVLTIYMLIGFI